MFAMKINSKKSYIISSIAIFIFTSIWLYIIKEERVGVYTLVLLISVILSGYIVDLKSRYRILIDFIAILCFLFLVGLEVLGIVL